MVDATIVRVHQHVPEKSGQLFQAMRRSRGGLTTKIHALVDALGNPLRFELTAGQSHDSVMGYEMLQTLDLTQKQILADQAYDTIEYSAYWKRKRRRLLFRVRKTAECNTNEIKRSTNNGIW
jgi:transposase